eukprot:jgi/Antlo1/2365/198
MEKNEKVWVDGCYDLFHYGHANGLRQAREMGDGVVLALHSNASILHNKGLPVMEDIERYEVARSCRWATELVEDAPFVTDMEIVRKYGCSMVFHSDDTVNDADGNDCYREARAHDIYGEFERTQGISTTEIVGRMLLRRTNTERKTCQFQEYQKDLVDIFSSSIKNKSRESVVFVDGTFDLFHAGHVSLLKHASTIGSHVTVGLYTDENAKKIHGEYPILSFLERKLVLLSCRYVDEVIEAPEVITPDFLRRIGAKQVLCGKHKHSDAYNLISSHYAIARVDHEFSYLTEKLIVQRIFDNYEKYMERNRKKLNL